MWWEEKLIFHHTRCWFEICFIFTPIWGRFPIWLIFLSWVGNHQPGYDDVMKWCVEDEWLETWVGWFLGMSSNKMESEHHLTCFFCTFSICTSMGLDKFTYIYQKFKPKVGTYIYIYIYHTWILWSLKNVFPVGDPKSKGEKFCQCREAVIRAAAAKEMLKVELSRSFFFLVPGAWRIIPVSFSG